MDEAINTETNNDINKSFKYQTATKAMSIIKNLNIEAVSIL
jgi:hypothetical protein